MRWVGHATRTVKIRNSNKIFVERTEGKKPLRIHRRMILK
jgi:hypothetical protein